MTDPTSEKRRREKIIAILSELESRGVPPPQEVLDALRDEKKPVIWNLNPYGYFYRKDGTPFKPNEKQEPFVSSTARFVALFSGRGGGKTACGAQMALKKIKAGEDGAVMNPDFENFKLSTWPEFREWIPWEIVVPAQRRRQNPEWEPNKPFDLIFDLGWKKVRVICKGVKDPDSARGPNINWLWYDEAGRDDTGLSWLTAIASVRVGKDPQCWVTTTPRGDEHWTADFFLEEKIDLPEDILKSLQETGRPLTEHYFTTILDNKDNLDPGFMAAMLAKYPEGWLRRQELFGEFVSQEGAIGGDAADALRNNQILKVPDIVYGRVRFWDLAATERKLVGGKLVNDPDETVGTKMSWDKESFFLEDQVGGFWDWDGILDAIVRTAKRDGPTVRIVIEQEPAAGGKNQVAAVANHVREKLPTWPTVQGWLPREAGDRVMGFLVWSEEAVNREIFVVAGDWVDGCIRQIADFPIAKHDDKVTSITGARFSLAPVRKWKTVPFLKV